ncbi:MAG: hypothetical protein F6K24_43150 [Okeania sp. SIO2D1]|nr:hypothetical protein [Okeania sp. SIO2D1]
MIAAKYPVSFFILVVVHSNGKGSVGRWGPTRAPLRWRGMWGDGECGKN